MKETTFKAMVFIYIKTTEGKVFLASHSQESLTLINAQSFAQDWVTTTSKDNNLEIKWRVDELTTELLQESE